MLISLKLTLTAQTAAILPAHIARAVHSATLDHLSKVDSDTAAQVHDKPGLKPFTCSDLLRTQTVKGSRSVSTGDQFKVRLTAYASPVAQLFYTAFIGKPPTAWNLHGLDFHVTSVTTEQGQDSWTTFTTFEDLVGHHFTSSRHQSDRLVFELGSPTAFRSNGLTVPLPLPDLFFGSLLNRWNAVATVTLDQELHDWVRNHVAVSRLNLESHPVSVKGGMHVGSTGIIHYRILKQSQYECAALNLLADFALFSGVGIKTTMGMGQVRCLSE